MSSIKQLLSQARDLISEPGHWTKRVLARNAKGEAISPTSPDACSWCIIGALVKVSGSEELAQEALPAIGNAIRSEFPHLASFSITDFNDGSFNRFRNHSEVVRVLDKAIEQA